MRHLNYAWRLVGTGMTFAFIFFGGGLLAVTLLPLLSLLPGHRHGRAQKIIHIMFRLCVCLLQVFGVAKLQIVGRDKLVAAPGRIIVANHPSLLDVVLLMALIPKSQCVVKHELWHHPLLGALMRQAGYIRNDMESGMLAAACQASLARATA